MKKIFLLTLIVTALLSCQNNSKKVKEDATVIVVEVDDSLKTEKVFEEFKSLYINLISFKNKEDFKKNGFGAGGSYHKWLKDVEEIKSNPDSKLLSRKGVLIGELEQLGFAYVNSKGKETEVTKTFNKIFTEAIFGKQIEKKDDKSGNSNYEKIKAEYELFGKWSISNSMAKEKYPYEIYKRGTEFVGVIAQGEYKIEVLVKNGDRYVVKGNDYGEYYKIDSKMNMSLFDKDGELASMGYSAVRTQ